MVASAALSGKIAVLTDGGRSLGRDISLRLARAGADMVNAVSPGALDTDFNAHAFEAHPEMRGFISANTALGRVGTADDVGGVVAFLCTEDARWITGQRVEVSGGMFL